MKYIAQKYKSIALISSALSLATSSISQAALTFTTASSNTVIWTIQGNTYSITGKIGNPTLNTTMFSERLDVSHTSIAAHLRQSASPFESYIQNESISYLSILNTGTFPTGDTTTVETHDRARAVRGVTGLQGGAVVGRNYFLLSAYNNSKFDSLVAFDLSTETSAPAIAYVIFDSDGELSASDIDYNSNVHTVAENIVNAPEPSSAILLGSGLFAFALRRRRS